MNKYTRIILSISFCCLSASLVKSQYTQTSSLKPGSNEAVLAITNSTSGQSVVTVQTNVQTVQVVALPNESTSIEVDKQDVVTGVKIYPTSNKPNNLFTPAIIAYKPGIIQKITITRLSNDMPQIIYYNGETNVNKSNNIAGIQSMNSNKQSIMHVLGDYADINGVQFRLDDLSSFVTKITNLYDSLSLKDIDRIKKEIEEVTADIKLIKKSDKNNQLIAQITVIELGISKVSSSIPILESCQKMLKDIESLQKNMNIYNVDETEQSYKNIQLGVKTMKMSNLDGILLYQIKTIESALKSLQDDITKMQTQRKMSDHRVITTSSDNETMGTGNNTTNVVTMPISYWPPS